MKPTTLIGFLGIQSARLTHYNDACIGSSDDNDCFDYDCDLMIIVMVLGCDDDDDDVVL